MNLNALIGLEEAAAYCCISVETLTGWVASRHAPHHFVDGKGPFFMKGEIRGWVESNLVQSCPGMPVPKRVDVLWKTTVLSESPPPPALAAIDSLCVVPLAGMISGIYFLCKGPEVVYVGKAVKVVARIAQHIAEGKKDFDQDRVFFVPCPLHSLDQTERHFIRALQPRYNGNLKGNPDDRATLPIANAG